MFIKRLLFRQKQLNHRGLGEYDYGTRSHTAEPYSCLQVWVRLDWPSLLKLKLECKFENKILDVLSNLIHELKKYNRREDNVSTKHIRMWAKGSLNRAVPFGKIMQMLTFDDNLEGRGSDDRRSWGIYRGPLEYTRCYKMLKLCWHSIIFWTWILVMFSTKNFI